MSRHALRLAALLCASGACSGVMTQSGATDGGADVSFDVGGDSEIDSPVDAQDSCPQPPPVAQQAPELVATVAPGHALMAYGHSVLGTVWTEYDDAVSSPFHCEDAWWLPDDASQPSPFGPSSCLKLAAVADSAIYLTMGSDTFAFAPVNGGLAQLGDMGNHIWDQLLGLRPAFVGHRLVYWDGDDASGWKLMSQPTPLGTSEQLADFPHSVGTLVSDGARLFVESTDASVSTAHLYEVSVPSGTQRLVGVFPEPWTITTGGGYVYQSDWDQTMIEQIDVETGTLVVAIATGYAPWTNFFADAEYLYFEDGNMDIYRRKHCGGPVELIEHGATVYALQQDREFLYWSDGAHNIERLRKPP